MDDLGKLKASELKNKAQDLRKQIANMRFDKAAGKIVDTAAPRRARKELARVLTLLATPKVK